MDLPIDLSSLKVISGKDEIKQNLYLLFKEQRGGFLQNLSLGSKVQIHDADADLIEEHVRATVAQLRGVEFVSVIVQGENVLLVIKFDEESVDYKFNIKEIYGTI